jgi:transposase
MSTAAPLPDAAPTISGHPPETAQLPNDIATLQRMVLELLATLQEERHDKQELRDRLDRLLRRLYGPKTERLNPDQPWLFAALAEAQGQEPEATASAAAEPANAKDRRRAKPHGRRRLPEQLPRRPLHYTLTEAERLCSCGQLRVDIGVEQSEQLDWQPASVFVWQHLVHKYACPGCAKNQGIPKAAAAATTATAEGTSTTETTAPVITAAPAPATPVVIAAPKPAMPIAKGLPGAGLLAHVIVSKFVDHLPLYRQEQILGRHGVDLKRSTLCDWLGSCAAALTPLYELMVSTVLQSRVLHTDDTPVTLQDHEPDASATGRVWAYLGDAAHPYNVFQFTPNRKRDGPREFLKEYRGYLQADAFSGYDVLYLPDPVDGQARIIEVACNAHARRKFYDARTSDGVGAHQALAWYAQLFELERRAKELSDEQRRQLRQELALPILKCFKAWLDEQRGQLLPKSPMAEAIGYALNQWDALIRYTEAGYLCIDNNWAEREMKRIAIGRKNWLFFGNAKGGTTAAVLLSFTSTCQRLNIEPWAYLSDVLGRLPTTSPEQLTDLAPDRWHAARKPEPTSASTPAASSPAAGLPTSI